MDEDIRTVISLKLYDLVHFAIKHKLLELEDYFFSLNRLIEVFQIDAPADDILEIKIPGNAPETASKILASLCNLAVSLGIIQDNISSRNNFSARLMNCVMPSPKEIRSTFIGMYQKDPKEATDEFYRTCRACNYIQVDAIKQNILFFADTEDCGKLEITINLSKPEKDPRDIAKLASEKSIGYPKCMLCVENSGYAGRSDYPARQNHRMIPISLKGKPWYFQYSPYSYYNEHCIVFNGDHIPMRIDRGTFERLFDFLRQFPHYFIGSNADLPIVGGSILNHDHFQGGRHTFPFDLANIRCSFKPLKSDISVGILEWPMSTIVLESNDSEKLIDESVRILNIWRNYSDMGRGILSATDGIPHNTITPILKMRNGRYFMRLVLRNNRTDDKHPLGIFHPHQELHHIKKENIGLIEVMGLFILPGRLKKECSQIIPVLTGKISPDSINENDAIYKHVQWIRDIISINGLADNEEAANNILKNELGIICERVLKDAGVFKSDENGREGFLRFMNTCGYKNPT